MVSVSLLLKWNLLLGRRIPWGQSEVGETAPSAALCVSGKTSQGQQASSLREMTLWRGCLLLFCIE